VRHRHARRRRSVGVEDLITHEGNLSEPGRSRVRPGGRWSARPASGRRGAEADDARAREVRPCRSSDEACERSRETGDGAGGAKGRGRGEREPAKHAPGTEPGKCVTGAGARTAMPQDSACITVTHPRWEPYAGKPHVRFCAGGAQQWASLPRSAFARHDGWNGRWLGGSDRLAAGRCAGRPARSKGCKSSTVKE